MASTDTQGVVLPHSIAHLTATRTCRFETEPPLVIEHREALAFMLHEAAELEHLIMCQYLFAAFTMKRSTDEGVTADQLTAIARWRKTVRAVAKQEMLHLALVQNLLVAIGWAPHFERPSLPAPAHHFPPGVQFALMPFGERALRHFLFLERPEGISIDDAEGFEAVARAEPYSEHSHEGEMVPHPQDFSTVGHLYRAIVQRFERLVERHGESRVFVGPANAQATRDMFGWPQLVQVVDLASARAACETIVEQGEGASGEWREAHFGRFHDIYDELLDMRERDPEFAPARPAVAGVVRPADPELSLPVIDDHTTSHLADLFNVAYEVLLQALARSLVDEGGDRDRRLLAEVAVGLMSRVIDPLGEMVTRMPFGPERAGATAGPTFELFFRVRLPVPPPASGVGPARGSAARGRGVRAADRGAARYAAGRGHRRAGRLRRPDQGGVGTLTAGRRGAASSATTIVTAGLLRELARRFQLINVDRHGELRPLALRQADLTRVQRVVAQATE